MSEFARRFGEAVAAGTSVVEAPGVADTAATFARSVAEGLAGEPKSVPYRFLYDAEGSRLFEAITDQPEYYPTRTEAAILEQHADEICAITGPVTLVELGSGYSVKTGHLLSAYSRGGVKTGYVPVDVSESALREASRSISASFPDVNFTGISGTYDSAFAVLGQLSPQMVMFLGSSLGNFDAAGYDAFWQSVAEHLPVGDFFLLGVDLVKDAATLDAAYNDAAGVTARFTVNYFTRMNRELGTDIDVDRIEHVAAWNPEFGRIEVFARFTSAERIRLETLDRTFDIDAGELVLLEISQKYRLPELTVDLAQRGLRLREAFTDEKGWFGLLLLERVGDDRR